MENQANFLLDWSHLYHAKSTEELTEALLIATIELETARIKAREELKMKDDALMQMKQLLNAVIIERNEAQNRYQKLLLQCHRQTAVPPPHSVSSMEAEHVNNGFSSSDCEESIVSSSVSEQPVRFKEQKFGFPIKCLPEKGKFLEAVIKAGPLLQNLLLAGPLPHWQHPPPALKSYQIPTPPVLVPTPAPVHGLVWKVNKKRGNSEGYDSSMETKYQRVNIT